MTDQENTSQDAPVEQKIQVEVDSGSELTESERQFLDKAFPTAENKQTNTAKAGAKADGAEQSSDQQQEQREAQRPKGWDKAVKALKLDGWTEEDLAAMDPDRVVAMGRKAKDRHSEIGKKLQSKDRGATGEEEEGDEDSGEGDDSPKRDSKGRFSQAGEQDDSDSEGEEDSDPEGEDEDRGSAEPARQPVDLERIKSLVKPLSDAIGLGDDVGDELAKVLEQAIKPLQDELAGYRQYHERLVWERGEELGQKAREKLSSQFPGLNDEEKFQAVVQRMSTLAGTKQYQDMESLMLDAAKIELFEDNRLGSARNSISSKRAAGQPVTTSRSMPAKALNSEDREDLALDAIFKGLGRDAAKRAYDGQ